MFMVRLKWGCFLLAMFMMNSLCADYGRAEDKSFYNRKVIEIIVATKVGGGFDTDGRLIAPYLQRALPGSTVIVRNVPGGGHIVGTNRVWEAPPNGLTIGVADIPGLIAAQVRGEKGVRFDLQKFTWLGRLYSRHRFLIARKNAGFDTIEALMKNEKEFKIGVSGAGAAPYNTGLLTAEALGLKKVRMIPNYQGSDGNYGIMRKEIEGGIGGLESWNELIEEGVALPILCYDSKRYPSIPQVPALSELVKDTRGKAIAAYVAGESELQRAIFTTPNMPNSITQILREALMKALQSEDFKKTIAKMRREAFDPLPGDVVTMEIRKAVNVPPEVADLIRKISKQAAEK